MTTLMIPAFADQAPVLVAVEDGLGQPGLEVIELMAGVAQPCYFYGRVGAKMQSGAARQAEEVKVSGSDVLAKLAWREVKAATSQFVMELGMDEMDLSQVRLSRVGPDSGAMLNPHSGMRIAAHPDPRDELNGVLCRLAELVHTTTADRDYDPNVSAVPTHPDSLAADRPQTIQ